MRIKVNLKKIQCNLLPYKRLLRKAVDKNGTAWLVERTAVHALIAKDEYDALLGTVSIPLEAIKE